MTRYFDNPNTSLEDSLQGPLKEIDLNDSDNFLDLVPKRSPKLGNTRSYLGRNDVRRRNKENSVDIEKLPVFHRGQYGEQAGTLIARHYVQKDSKCIQCRNCGIFFNTSAFLTHCHNQYGKRSQCSAVQLQLALDNPTTQQKDVWNRFQKKISSGKSKVTNLRPDSAAAKHIQNLDMPFTRKAPGEYHWQQNSRYTRAEAPGGYDGKNFSNLSSQQNHGNLQRSKRFHSASALNVPDSLTMSELSSRGVDKRSSPPTVFDYEARRQKDTFDASWRNANHLLPDRFQQRNNNNALFQSAPLDRYEWRNSSPQVDINPNSASLSVNPFESSLKPATTDPAQYYFKPIKDDSKSEKSCIENPKSLISQACILLQKASDEISRAQGGNSNAWRKMYEEERDHRMQLEAKVRDLEHELRSRKT